MTEHSIKEDIFYILRVLSYHSDLTQRDISGTLGFSSGKTNHLLRELAKKGFLKVKSFSRNDDKTKKVKYILTKRGFEEKSKLTLYFLKKKEEEYMEIKREAEALGKGKESIIYVE